MSSLLELLTAVLVLMNSAEDGDDFLLSRKRHRSGDLRTGLADGLDDLLGGCINEFVIIRLKGDSHYLICHKKSPSFSHFLKQVRQAVTVHTPVCVRNPEIAHTSFLHLCRHVFWYSDPVVRFLRRFPVAGALHH